MQYRQNALLTLIGGLALMSSGVAQAQDPATQLQLFQLQRQQEQQQIEQRQREAQQQQLQQQQLYQQQQQLQLQRQQDQLLQLQSIRQLPPLQAGVAPLALSASATQTNIKTWDQLVAYVQYVAGINTLTGEMANEYTAAKAALSIPHEMLTHLEQLRTELLTETETYRTNTGVNAAALVISINRLCNVILDLVPSGSPDLPQNLLRESLAQSLTKGKFDLNAVRNILASAAIADKASAGKNLLDSAIALQKIAEEIVANAAPDRSAASAGITQQLELIDEQIAAYQNAVQQPETLSSTRQEIDSAVTVYLNSRADVLFTAPPVALPAGASGNGP